MWSKGIWKWIQKKKKKEQTETNKQNWEEKRKIYLIIIHRGFGWAWDHWRRWRWWRYGQSLCCRTDASAWRTRRGCCAWTGWASRPCPYSSHPWAAADGRIGSALVEGGYPPGRRSSAGVGCSPARECGMTIGRRRPNAERCPATREFYCW